MVAVKAHQAEAFLKSPERMPPAVLFYGTDAGPGERTGRACSRGAWPSATAARCCASTTPTSRTIRPASASSCRPWPMFGGRKVVRAAGRPARQRQCPEAAGGGRQLEGFLIVEAGNLRPDEALRALFEKSPARRRSPAFPTRRAISTRWSARCCARPACSIAPEAKRLLIGAARRRSRAVARRGGEAGAFRARQDHDRGSRRGGRGRRCRGAGAGPHRAGRRLGPQPRKRSRSATASSPPAKARKA